MLMGRKTKNISRPPFALSTKSLLRDTGRQIDWTALFTNQYRHGAFSVVVGVAGAAQGATTVPVLALKEAIAKGTVLNFGTNKFVTVNADAAAGATSLTTLAIPTALVSLDTAYHTNSGLTGFLVRAGTIVDILTNGKVVPSALNTGAVTAYGILETDADSENKTDALSGYGVLIGGDIYENLLPEADLTLTPPTITAAWKTELAARSGRFQFHQYTDSTA
jgi:hypothetical protein